MPIRKLARAINAAKAPRRAPAKKASGSAAAAVRRIARTIDAALTDADRAQKSVRDPGFRKRVREDRRGELSGFRTVKHLLRDRERIEKSKAAKKR